MGSIDPMHETAYKLLISPVDGMFIRSIGHRAITGFDFVPVCQYPVDWMPADREIGSLVKLKGDEVVEIHRRVLEARS